MSPSPASASTTPSRAQRRYDRSGAGARNPRAATPADRRRPKERSQRAMYACERCRLKKLRCAGGHPCSACIRSQSECDLGDRARDSEQHITFTNQRLTELERTVHELVSDLSHLTEHRQSSPPIQLSARPASSFSLSGQQPCPTALASSTGHQYQDSRQERIPHSPGFGGTSPHVSQNIPTPSTTLAARSDVVRRVRSHDICTTEHVSTLPMNPGVSDGIDSRWAALQQGSAPFPPMMTHPAVWSGEPAMTSPEGDLNAQSALGMTRYRAKVDLQSEPVSEGIVSEFVARTLFSLFFQKCHPQFPLLEPYKSFQDHFDYARSSSPFLFTTILAIAGRYYPVYQRSQPDWLPVSDHSFACLADLVCAHLGFAFFRKQHTLSDVQATLLLSVWIPKGRGQFADQWMVTGLCTRLAYRIGVLDLFSRPAVMHLLNSTQLNVNDIQEVNSILPQWHTWLAIHQHDAMMSLGFGRPHTMPAAPTGPREYLSIVRKLGTSAQVDPVAATYVASLAELSMIAIELTSGLRTARLPATPRQDAPLPCATTWSSISTVLSDLNPRLDDWQRQWTWSGSYDAIMLGRYSILVKIYGEHTRLCLNSLSLNLITAQAGSDVRESRVAISSLGRACEAAVGLVQYYVESSATEPIVRYGGDYFVLILGQAATFIVRVLVARLDQPLPIDKMVLMHCLQKAIELLETNDVSTTGVCGWVAQVSRDLANYAGLGLAPENDDPSRSVAVPDSNMPPIEWDFDISAFLGQNMPAGGTGLDLGHYFDFSFDPQPSSVEGQDTQNLPS